MPTFIENMRSFVFGAPSDGEIYEAFHCYLHAFMQYSTCNASSCACVQGSCPHRGISTLVLFINYAIVQAPLSFLGKFGLNNANFGYLNAYNNF